MALPSMYDAIVALAEDGPVRANHFSWFVGRRNWLTIDGIDVPTEDRDAGNDIGYVCEFEVARIFADSNTVRILVFFRSHPNGIAMDFDADELAIRIEDA